jgi:signal transduction histidine kinase
VVVRIEANEDSLGLTVADDGVGFEAKRTAEHGLGLLSMRERSAELGGNLKIVSQPGQGTLIRVTIPYPVTAKIT